MPSITVLAPVSLTEPLAEIIRDYSRQHGISVVVSYATAKTHADTVTDGEPADVIITDNTTFIRDLKNRGLLDVYAQSTLMPNPLVAFRKARIKHTDRSLNCLDDAIGKAIERTPVATVPYQEDRKLPWRQSEDRDSPLFHFTREMQNRQLLKQHRELRKWLLCRPLIIADEERTTAGRLSLELLDRLFIPFTGDAAPLRAAHARQVLSRVAASNAAIGITHYSDFERARQNGEAVEQIALMPGALYSVPLYQAFVVASENMPQGRQFVDYLKSDPAMAVFNKGWFAVE